ncbi:hypothetical protein [Devosia nitrariae]|uniref:Uncharacterized protein n=1 Tax=Devosia nitrariae TaxID=2071872 RepID=A0ABQ5W160_9HYPH|nr:hypothetical protein [Devosia nitrariae]GLQ53807.1 hypothetical protein GCM10010862_10660 [Devosia nitrariae]
MEWRSRFRQKLTSRGGWVVSITLVLASLTLVTIGMLMLHSPPPLVVIELETETLLQSVRRPDTSSIAMTGARLRLRGDAELPAQCSVLLSKKGFFSGIVRPEQQALVRYRWNPERILITIAARGKETVLIGADEGRCAIPAQDDLNIDLPKPGGIDPTSRLPIAGPAAAGGEFGVPVLPGRDRVRDMTFLRSGTVKVFGRSDWPFGQGELYAVEPEGFIIPAGSRLASSGNISLPGDEAGASWYGVAEYSDHGFKVSATAETSRLLLFRPGATGPEETFAVGLLARIISDPNVAFISIAFVVVSVVGQVIGGWVGTWREQSLEVRGPSPRPQPPATRRPVRKARRQDK